jgi:outer membrane lipoprotein-sorting protein
VNAQEAHAQFQAAGTLYQQGQHAQALQILQNLDQGYPNSKNILFPMALSLAALGRNQEAAALCDRLTHQLQDDRAPLLRARLNVPESGPSDGLALNNNFMVDLDQPRPAKKPIPVAAPSRMPLYAGIGGAVALVAVIAALFFSGALGDLLAKLKPETVESAVAKIVEAGSNRTAFTGAFQANAEMTQPMPMKINGSGNFDYLSSEGKSMFRVDASIVMENMGGMTQSITMVNDGTTIFQEMNIMGQTMVMKMNPAMPSAGAMMPNLNSISPDIMVDAVKEMGDIKLKRDEVIDNQPAYVFLVNPKMKAGSMPPGMPEFDSITMAVTKATGLPARLELKDKAGKTLLTVSFKNVVINLPSSPSKFKYTPPPGAKVMDMAEAGKMMPFPGMPGMK